MPCPGCGRPLEEGLACVPCATTAAELPHPGAHFAGRYEIECVLGRGGMGVVYRARDLVLRETVALKVIRPEHMDRPSAVGRFVREASLARKLTHPNICRIHDLGEWRGKRFLSMQLVEGETLEELLLARGAMSPKEVRHILRQLLGALDEAHRRGVIHRDLKPKNVVLTPAGDAILMDFGIAKSLTPSEGDPEMTLAGTTLGTPAYMAPELVQGAEASPATDLYALGITAYKLLTGHVPFEGRSAIEVFRKQVLEAPPSLERALARAPRDLVKLVDTTLAKDPAVRPQSALQALRWLLPDAPGSQDVETVGSVAALETLESRPPSPPLLDRARDRRRAALTLAFGVALGAVVAGAFAARLFRTAPTADRSVVVMPFREGPGIGPLAGTGSVVGDIVTSALGRAGGMRVVSRLKLERVLRRVGDAPSPETMAVETGAARIVTGSVLQAGGRIRVEAQVVDPASGDIVGTALREAQDPDALFDTVDRVAEDLVDRLLPGASVGGTRSTASLDAYRAYDRGIRSFARGDLGSARSELEAAVKADSSFALAWSRLASVDDRLGLRGRAREAVASALAHIEKLEPSERELVRATSRLHENRWALAAAHLERYLRVHPDDGLALVALAEAQLGRREYDRAIAGLTRAIQDDPGLAVAYERLGRAYRGKHDHTEALAWFARQAEQNKHSPMPDVALGQVHLARHEVLKAEVSFRHALELDPGFTPARVWQCRAALARRDFAGAERCIREALVVDPASAEAIAAEADIAFAMRRYDHALERYRALLSLDAQSREGLLGIGRVHLQRRAFDEARAWLERALEADPFFVDGMLALARVATEERHLDVAEAELARAAEVDPEDLRVRLARGQIDRSLRRFDRALGAAEDVLVRDPREVEALNLKGLVHDDRHQAEEAAAAYERAVRLDPYYTFGYNNIGVVKARGREFESAVLWLEKAIKLDPFEPLSYANLGLVYGLAGDLAEAERRFEEAVKLDPFDTGVLIARSGFYRETGRAARALDVLSRADELNPADERVHYERGQALRALGRDDESRQAFVRALDRHPRMLEAALALGALDLAAHKGKETAVRLERIVEANDADAAVRISRMYVEGGARAEAARWLERALSADPANVWVPYDAARDRVRAGERDEALRLLETALERGFADPRLLASDPAFDALRGDPRFVAIVGRMPRPQPVGSRDEDRPMGSRR